MRILVIFVLGFFVFFSHQAFAEKMIIAAAASLKPAMEEILRAFKAQNTGSEIEVVFGSSGKMCMQITQGAPYDMFFSADREFPDLLVQKNFAASEPKIYAMGQLVLWSATRDASQMKLDNLLDSKIKRVAIANPKHAPYGRRAEEALRKSGLWDKLQPKLVFGEDISQAAHFAQSGNADVGILAMSLVISSDFKKLGGFWLIPQNLYTPLEQTFVFTKLGKDKPLAKKFSEYILQKSASDVFVKHGLGILKADGNK